MRVERRVVAMWMVTSIAIFIRMLSSGFLGNVVGAAVLVVALSGLS